MNGFLTTNAIPGNEFYRDVMNYWDGNTVTAVWNYAQHFGMNDNFFSSTFGASTPGFINLISGQTRGAEPLNEISINNYYTVDGTIVGDAEPLFDMCTGPHPVKMTGKNIGNLLNERGITWGWFAGGFREDCNARPRNYNPHDEPFQYYKSTSNFDHLPPRNQKI